MPGKISPINLNRIIPVPSSREKLLSREKRYPGRFGLMQHSRSLSLAADPLFQNGTLPGGMRPVQSEDAKKDERDNIPLKSAEIPAEDQKQAISAAHQAPGLVPGLQRQSSIVKSIIKAPGAVSPPGYWLTGLTLDPDRLELGKRLGGGAFGDVYEGMYRGVLVAVKTITKQLNPALMQKLKVTYNDLIEGIESEAIRLSGLNHPNIAGCYGSVRKDGQFCLVMEYCENGDVKGWLYNENPNLQQKWLLALETAYGLAYLHEQGVVHRDVKADNVLRDGQGKAKLTDLGLAQADKLLRDREQRNLAEAKSDAGPRMTVSVRGPYAAPEEKKGMPSTEESDMYSYGLLLWQLVTGRNPRRLSLRALIEGIPADCPQAMRAVIEGCLIEEPENRLKADQAAARLEGMAAVVYGSKGLGIRVIERTDQLLHGRKNELREYIEPHISDEEVKESWDSYWQQREGKEEKKASLNLKYLANRMARFLATKERVMTVIGDAGTGKTLSTCALAEKWQKQWAEEFKEGQTTEEMPWLPIMIRPGIEAWSQTGISGGIAKALGSDAYGLDEKAQEILKTSYRVIFILDGYDEIHLSGERENIGALLGLQNWPQAKLVITTRPGVVEEKKEQEIFGVNGVYASSYVLPFNIRQMLKYLREQWNGMIRQKRLILQN